jgi:putative transposase
MRSARRQTNADNHSLTSSEVWGIIQALELTVVAKLDLSPQDKQRVERTLDVFADACNAISHAAFTERCFNPVALHHLTYYDIRQRFNLHANLAVNARARVAKAYQILKVRKQPVKLLTFKPQSLDLDAKLFRLFLKDDEIWVSIAACGGERVKCRIKVGQRYLPILKASKPTFAVLKRHRETQRHESQTGSDTAER